MSRNVTGVRVAQLGDVVTLKEYCALFRECESKVRQQLKTGTCRVPPAFAHPPRWRRVDLETELLTSTASADRRKHAKAKQQETAASPA